MALSFRAIRFPIIVTSSVNQINKNTQYWSASAYSGLKRMKPLVVLRGFALKRLRTMRKQKIWEGVIIAGWKGMLTVLPEPSKISEAQASLLPALIVEIADFMKELIKRPGLSARSAWNSSILTVVVLCEVRVVDYIGFELILITWDMDCASRNALKGAQGASRPSFNGAIKILQAPLGVCCAFSIPRSTR